MTRLVSRQGVQSAKDKKVSYAFDRIVNGYVSLLEDTKRVRQGKIKLPEYCVKSKGYTIKNTVTGGSGGGRGGIMYVDPVPTGTDRERIIYAVNNQIRLYSVTNGTDVLLRDVNTTDSKTLAFLSGVQMKKYGYFCIGDSTDSANLYKYSGTSSGAFSAFADHSGTVAGTVKATDVAHGMVTGNTVTIAGTTNYNGTFVITKVDADNFYFTDTWVANDATGTWTGETITTQSETGLNASRLLYKMDDRLQAVGMGDNSATVQYSYLKSDGAFTVFTSSSSTEGGGTLSGSLDSVTALSYLNGLGIVFERGKITAHTIGSVDIDGSGRVKEIKTIKEDATITGIGTPSARGMIEANDMVFFVTNGKGIYRYDPAGRSIGGRLVELTSAFRPNLDTFDFSDSSVAYNDKLNQLYVTCSSSAGIGANTILIYGFDSESWSVDENKRVNQLFYAPISRKIYGTSSSGAEIHELYETSYQNNGTDIEMSCETRMYDMSDDVKQKAFISLSVVIGAENDSQNFTFEIFTDDNTTASSTETKSVTQLLQLAGKDSGVWGGEVVGGGVPTGGSLGFVTYFFDGFVQDFARISLKVTERGVFRAAVGVPTIRDINTDDKVSSF